MKQFVRPTPPTPNPVVSALNAVTLHSSDHDISLFRETKRPSRQVDMVELTRLYNTIERGIGRAGGIFLLVGATAAEQSADTLHDLAWAGSSLLGKRVLFVKLTDGSPADSAADPPASNATLGLDPLRTQALIEQTISQGLGAGVYVASIPYDRNGDGGNAFPQLQSFLHNLRPAFDLILVAPPPVLNSPLAGALCSFADGSILFLESGKSRFRSANRAINILSNSHAPFLGVVLTNSVDPRPSWVRKWFWS